MRNAAHKLGAVALILTIIGGVCGLPAAAAPDQPAPSGRLSMSEAVACKSITGYEQYEPLDEAAITEFDKLLIYYRPLDFTIKRMGKSYVAHLSQDARVRRRGQKEVLWKKENVIDYKVENPIPPRFLYFKSHLSLQGLPPGEYDLDLILHDKLSTAPPAQQVLHFRIKPPAPADAPADDKTAPKGKPPRPRRKS